MSEYGFGVSIIGEWKLTGYTFKTSPDRTLSSSGSIFFRADNTFSFSSMTAASEGTWRELGNMVEWQFSQASPQPLPNLYMGSKIGNVMQGLKWIFQTPSMFTKIDGYWYAIKV